MKTYQVSGTVVVSCWTKVDAESEEQALLIASTRPLADISIDGSFPLDESFHIDCDGVPRDLKVDK